MIQMHSNFFVFLFWLNLLFIVFNLNSVLILLMSTEIIWGILYSLNLINFILINDLNLLSIALFSLGISVVDLGVGIILTLFLKKLKNTTQIESNNLINQKLTKSGALNYITRYIWKI